MTITATRMVELAEELLSTWLSPEVDQSFTVRRGEREATAQQFAAVHGLAAHVHQLASVAIAPLREHHVLEALPLIRAAYECALTAQWVAQTDDGASAFVNKDLRQRRRHVHTLESAVSQVFREAAPNVAARIMDELPTTASARNFETICLELQPGGKDAYAIYRMMSHLSHASVLVADQYLSALDRDPWVALRMEADQPDPATWTFFVPVTLVWAGRAVDFFDGTRRRRSQLRAAARELKVESALQLSDAAVLRQQQARFQR